MKLEVFLWSCFLVVGGFANPSHPETGNEGANDLQQLLSEFTDATTKWSSLYEKFENLQMTECAAPENAGLCKAIQEQAAAVTGKVETLDEQMDGDMRILTTVLSSLQEKVDKLERKMETGVGGTISTRDYIQAMKGLERRLHYFQAAIMNLGKDMKMPMRYVDATEDDAAEEFDRMRPERASGRGYDEDDVRGIKHLGKTCKMLVGPYKRLISSVERLEESVKDVKACGSRSQVAPYKNSMFKDIKDMLQDISDDIKSLRKMSSREMNENEKILKKINKKLEKELKDDDKDDEDLKKSLKKFMVEQRKALEKTIKKALSKRDDTDDTDDDDDDDTDDSNERGTRRSKDDSDDDDDDDDDSCDDSDSCSRKKKGKDTDNTDDSDDDDDDDDTDNDKKGRKKGKDDTDDSDEDDDDDDDDTDDTDDDRKTKKKKNRENMTKKYSEEKSPKDVEVLRNSASAGPFGKNKFVTSLFGIPPYIDH